MDDRLEKALGHANYALTVARQKKNMQAKFQIGLLYSINGGSFLATPELISFVDLLIRQGNEDAILIDQNSNPIRVDDLPVFLDNLTVAYHGAANEFFSGYEKLRKGRNVKAVIGQ